MKLQGFGRKVSRIGRIGLVPAFHILISELGTTMTPSYNALVLNKQRRIARRTRRVRIAVRSKTSALPGLGNEKPIPKLPRRYRHEVLEIAKASEEQDSRCWICGFGL